MVTQSIGPICAIDSSCRLLLLSAHGESSSGGWNSEIKRDNCQFSDLLLGHVRMCYVVHAELVFLLVGEACVLHVGLGFNLRATQIQKSQNIGTTHNCRFLRGM